jgi:hypothetical protein
LATGCQPDSIKLILTSLSIFADKKNAMPHVTPIQGPIYLKNGTVPVVPLFAYNQVNNGTFLQIPVSIKTVVGDIVSLGV